MTQTQTQTQTTARPAEAVRAIRLARGRTRRALRRDAAALYRAAAIVAARGDGNEAARVRGVADDYARAVRYARYF